MTDYTITIITSDQNQISRIRIALILFRTNDVNFQWYYIGFYYHYNCTNTACFNGVTLPTSYTNPDYKDQNRFYYGVRGFNFTKKG